VGFGFFLGHIYSISVVNQSQYLLAAYAKLENHCEKSQTRRWWYARLRAVRVDMATYEAGGASHQEEKKKRKENV
jgi:hypothetical protein